MKIIRNNFISILLLFTISGYLFPQDEIKSPEIKNFIGVNFGGSDFHLKDEHASPLIFSSIGITPGLQYFYMGEVNRHYFEASYFSDRLTSISDNYFTDNRRGRFRYSYLHSITDFSLLNKRIDFFLGGSVCSFLSQSEYYYQWLSSTYSRAMESWYWCNSLDLSAQLEYRSSSREFFSLQFYIPVIGNVSRPKYSPSADYNYVENDWKFKMLDETGFFPEDLSLNTILTYQRSLYWNINFEINYEFYYSFYKEPQKVNMFMNNLRAGIFYCF